MSNKSAAGPAPFRVHFEDGSAFDTVAASPEAARDLAKPVALARQTIIIKTKKIKGGHHGR